MTAPSSSFDVLRGVPVDVQQAEGYGHTLAEIRQQPELWLDSARRAATASAVWRGLSSQARAILLTGSGSSYFVGKSISHALQEALAIPVMAVESGEILLSGKGVLPPERPLLLVSFARSGDSPESWGLVQYLLEDEPGIQHLLITCNPQGRLAHTWGESGTNPDSRVKVLVLDERSCDKSLVMTSSFTSMAVAGLGLGLVRAGAQAHYIAAVESLSRDVAMFLNSGLAPLEEFPLGGIERMVAVGSGCLHGAALEVSLKMLEMTDGRVFTRAEGCLGLRHGPMCAVNARTMVFFPLSAHPLRRAYQLDLLAELDHKQLGAGKVIIGGQIPQELRKPGDLIIELPALRHLGDEWLAVASVVAGQLLAFRRCRAEGLRPDQPAMSNSISRVVGNFTLHHLGAGVR